MKKYRMTKNENGQDVLNIIYDGKKQLSINVEKALEIITKYRHPNAKHSPQLS